MHKRLLTSTLGLAGALWGVVLAPALQAQVGPGWNGFDTVTCPFYGGVDWQGVPLGAFNFGGSIGVQNVGNTDTIIQRLGPTVTTPGGIMPITVAALQLQTVNPVSLQGGPLGYYYATLDTGQPNTGSLTISSFPSDGSTGNFSSTLDVFFDVRFGSLTGPIVSQASATLVDSGNWGVDPPPPPALPMIYVDLTGDRFIVTPDVGLTDTIVQRFYPSGTPEPSGLALLCLGLLGLAIKTRRG